MNNKKLLISKCLTMTAMILIGISAMAKPTRNRIEGRVFDKNSNEPLVFALVAIGKDSANIAYSTYTDSTGNYQIANVNEGTYYLQARMVGYKQYSESIAIDTLSAKSKDIKLDLETMKEVKVVGKKPFLEARADRLVMNTDAQISTVGESVFETLKRAPGVYIDKDDNIQLRGKTGVLILVNDRSTYLNGKQLASYLKGIQTMEVEKIEIITNPPAKYDASGNSGVINIKLKKNSKMGLNGTLWGGAWQKEDKTNGNVGGNLNFRSGKLNVFANEYTGWYKGYNTMSLERTIDYNNTQSFFDQKSRNDWNYNTFGYNLGVDYDINSKNTIGIMYRTSKNTGDSKRTATNYMYNASSIADSSLHAISTNDDSYENQSINLNYKINIDTTGKEFSVDLDYAQYNNGNDNNLNTFYLDASNVEMRSPSFLKGHTPTDIDIKSIKMDYIHPYKGYRFEAGLKASSVNTDNKISYQTFTNNSWIEDYRRSNQFEYEENILAGYLSVSKDFGNTSLKGGLRAENTYSDGNSVTMAQRVKRDYIDFFPTFFVQQKLNDNHSVGFNYNRRIDRPNYESLNPFIYYIDEYTYGKGNAFLNPQYTNSFTLNYNFKNALFTSLSYNRTNDPQLQLLRQNDSSKVTYETTENFDLSENFNLNIGFNSSVTKWYRINVSFNAYLNKFANNKDDISNNSYSINMWSGHYISLPKDFSLELTTWYQAPQTYGVYESQRHMFNLGIGVQKQLFNQKAQIKLFANDILNTGSRYDATAKYSNVSMKFNNRWDSRQFGFSFSYRFGRDDIKPSRNRSTGLDDEQKRVKSGK